MSSNEHTLVKRAQQGDVDAFETLYRTHVAAVYGLCKRLLTKQADAEEVCQEVFIKAWRHIEQFNMRAQFSTWLYRIASNEAIGRLKQESRWQQSTSFDEEHVHDEPPVSHLNAEQSLVLEGAIAQLPDRARAVLILFDVLGYSHDEIASVSGIAPGTSRAHLHSARAKLKGQLR